MDANPFEMRQMPPQLTAGFQRRLLGPFLTKLAAKGYSIEQRHHAATAVRLLIRPDSKDPSLYLELSSSSLSDPEQGATSFAPLRLRPAFDRMRQPPYPLFQSQLRPPDHPAAPRPHQHRNQHHLPPDRPDLNAQTSKETIGLPDPLTSFSAPQDRAEICPDAIRALKP